MYLAAAASSPPSCRVPNWPIPSKRGKLFEPTKFCANFTIADVSDTWKLFVSGFDCFSQKLNCTKIFELIDAIVFMMMSRSFFFVKHVGNNHNNLEKKSRKYKPLRGDRPVSVQRVRRVVILWSPCSRAASSGCRGSFAARASSRPSHLELSAKNPCWLIFSEKSLTLMLAMPYSRKSSLMKSFRETEFEHSAGSNWKCSVLMTSNLCHL